MNNLTYDLISEGYIRNDEIIDAFCSIRRMEFVPNSLQSQADANISLPVGFGQTISQPLTVAVMLELLNVKRGQKVLVVGSGSGWTTGLISSLVGANGKVVGLEIISELCDISKHNLDKYDFLKSGIVEIYNQDGFSGNRKLAPYDRIIVLASIDDLSHELEEQLKLGGKMVVPTKNRIILLTKDSKHGFSREEYPGFSFMKMKMD